MTVDVRIAPTKPASARPAAPTPAPSDAFSALLEALRGATGRDLRGYETAGLVRRLLRAATDLGFEENEETFAALRREVLLDARLAAVLVTRAAVTATELFRDPDFFQALRTQALPELRAKGGPLRLWVAGCASGEEVLSLAIVLAEEGALDDVRIYATDADETVISPERRLRAVTADADREAAYVASGGRRSLAYWLDRQKRSRLLAPVLFAPHDLAIDQPFQRFDLVLCRNVLTYFGPALRERALGVIAASQESDGILGIGRYETLRGTGAERSYSPFGFSEFRLYRRA